MRVIAVPVKSLDRSKSRLGRLLSPLERGALTLAMLEDVLDSTMAVGGWETWVVSPDEVVLEIAARRGVRPVAEEKPPLAGAIRLAERQAKEREANALAVLLGDVALVTPDALSAALHTLAPVVAAPDRSRRGTNLLLRRPPRVIPARFGKDSLARHQEAADAKQLPMSIVERPELAFDLDGAEDIRVLLDHGSGGRTRSALLEMDLPTRLARVS